MYTVGHSTRSLEEFVELLKHYGITLLIDIRRFPSSKKFPWFTREFLAEALNKAGIQYRWLGEDLGGYRTGGYKAHQKTAAYRRGIEEVKRLAKTETVALMCAELLWFRCHRRFVSDTLVREGFEVVHLYDLKRTQIHRLRERLEGFE